MNFDTIIKMKRSQVLLTRKCLIGQNINKIRKFVKVIRDKSIIDNINLTNTEVLKQMDDILINWVFSVENNFSISNVCLKIVLDQLIKNPQIALDKYKELGLEQIEKFDFDHTKYYMVNLDKHMVCLLVQLYKNIEYIQIDVGKYLIGVEEDNLEEMLRKEIVKSCQVLKEKQHKDMRSSLIDQICEIATALKRYGALERYNQTNNIRLDMLDLGFLEIPLQRNSKDNKIKFNALEDLCNKDILKSLDNVEAAIIDAFLLNRLAKEIQNYCQALYILRKLNLLDRVLSQQDIDIDNEVLLNNDLLEITTQHEFLKSHCENLVKEYIANRYVDLKQTDKYDFLKAKQVSDYYCTFNIPMDKISKKYKVPYEKYYNKVLNGYSNNFESDYDYVVSKFNVNNMIYDLKDQVMSALLILMLNNELKINWGYIHDNKKCKKVNERYILLGFDVKDFNTPVKLHFNKQKLMRKLEEYQGSTILPLYNGSSDMLIYKENKTIFYTAQIVIKLNDHQKKKLKQLYKNIAKSDYRYLFVKHLVDMMSISKRKLKSMDKKMFDLSTNRIVNNK